MSKWLLTERASCWNCFYWKFRWNFTIAIVNCSDASTVGTKVYWLNWYSGKLRVCFCIVVLHRSRPRKGCKKGFEWCILGWLKRRSLPFPGERPSFAFPFASTCRFNLHAYAAVIIFYADWSESKKKREWNEQENEILIYETHNMNKNIHWI